VLQVNEDWIASELTLLAMTSWVGISSRRRRFSMPLQHAFHIIVIPDGAKRRSGIWQD